MARLTLKFVHRFRDRHGKWRHYFRRPGFTQVSLPGLYASPEFMAAYTAALGGETSPKLVPGLSRETRGSMAALIASWYQGGDFKRFRKQTQVTYRGIAEAFRQEHGEKPVNLLEGHHIRRIMAKKAETPTAANNLLKVLRSIMKHAVADEWRADDPTFGIRPLKVRSDGFHTWTEAEIAQFQTFHKIGTRARLAFDLLLYTGQRRSDVVRMGRQHIQGDLIAVTQQKTGTSLMIPVHPALRVTIDGTKGAHLTFLTTAQGRGFAAAGFGNWFRDVCREAGLPDNCSAHGLRKAAARRLAEAGCTTKQIAAVTGHATLKEVERYTVAAEQETLARAAMAKIALIGHKK